MQTASVPSSEDAKYIAKWTKFISKNPLNQPKIWQYWRDDVRPKSQFNKKFISRFSKSVKAQQAAKGLIRSGIPNNHRGEVWWACSGGAELMAASQQSYADYMTMASDATYNPAAETILKDLHRTFICREVQHRTSLDAPPPPAPSFEDADAINPLKNILLAYSLRNPRVGYCQSMNFLCAMLLLHLGEEQAFWVLAALVEKLLLLDYYAPSMLGCRTDQLTFQSCLAWKLPRVFAHLREMDVILEPILCPWFLCIFLHVLPLDAVQRIWDCFFFEGNVILFRMGLAVCKQLETEILHADDIGSLFLLLKKPMEQRGGEALIEALLAAAFDKSWLGSLPRAALEHFRAEHLAFLRAQDMEPPPSLVDCETGGKKGKSAATYSGVERSLACVLQTSESFRGKIDARKLFETDEDVSVPLELLSTDDKSEGEGEEEDEIVAVSTIAFKPPPNRRTSVAMKSLLLQET